MTYLDNSVTATLVNIKLTNKGREFLTTGFKADNVFDIVKFSFGDSEVNYASVNTGSTLILAPSNESTDLRYKLYSSGQEPSGTATVSLTRTSVSMSKYQTGESVGVDTQWSPVRGSYIEQYIWTNLGPLNDYDFNIVKSIDTKTITLETFDVTGSTRIRVYGETSGKYEILTLNIV